MFKEQRDEGRIHPHVNIEELLSNWDGRTISTTHPDEETIRLHYIHLGPPVHPVYGYVGDYLLREARSSAPKEIQKYINENAKEMMSLFYLNGKNHLFLDILEGIEIAIYKHNSEAYTFEFEIEEAEYV